MYVEVKEAAIFTIVAEITWSAVARQDSLSRPIRAPSASGQWSGSFKTMLESRRFEQVRFAGEMPGSVADWISRGLPYLDRRIRAAQDLKRN